MSGRAALTREQLDRVREIAAVLVPGASASSAGVTLPGFDDLVQHAALALDAEDSTLAAALEALPQEVSWESLARFATADPSSFDQVSLLVVGAYFMSPTVLAELGLPTGERRRAHHEQVVDELSTGILDPVFERGCPVRTLEDVARADRSPLS